MAKILLVDDDAISLKSVACYFRLKRHVVQEASDGSQAIDQLKAGTFDLVISDVTMPRIDGLQLLQYMTSSFPQTPIMLMSGAQYEVADILRRGAADFVIKPLQLDALESKVNAIVTSSHVCL